MLFSFAYYMMNVFLCHFMFICNLAVHKSWTYHGLCHQPRPLYCGLRNFQFCPWTNEAVMSFLEQEF